MTRKTKLRGLFVTGTDTGVGKTWVAAGLLAALRRRGIDAVPMKPVQTGCTGRGADLRAPDLELSLAAAGLVPAPGERALMAPYLFRPACSPHLAAERAGVRIDLTRIARAARALAAAHEFVCVEGAGGVLVPLDGKLTMVDLMRRLGLPVLLVARAGLGTINHTLLSLRALRENGLSVAGVVFNQAGPGPWGMIEADNVKTVARLGQVPVAACLRHQPGRRGAAANRQALEQLAAWMVDDMLRGKRS